MIVLTNVIKIVKVTNYVRILVRTNLFHLN